MRYSIFLDWPGLCGTADTRGDAAPGTASVPASGIVTGTAAAPGTAFAVLVGTLWLKHDRGRLSSAFRYAPAWLEHPSSFALSPDLPLTKLTVSCEGLFAAFQDCTPNRWGRRLLQLAEHAAARREQRSPRTLLASDFLIRVPDALRQGSLRLHPDPEDGSGGTGNTPAGTVACSGSAKAAHSATFRAASAGTAPPLASLPRLLAAALAVQAGEASETNLTQLLPAGAALGGARPKACLAGADGTLFLAKFPTITDAWDVPLWEYVCLRLAQRAGLRTPSVQLKKVSGRSVLCVQRFDRSCGWRVPFLSAMSLLGKQDGEQASYTDIACALQEAWQAAGPDGHTGLQQDVQELWARMVFNMCICNTDDHLRNHAFLRHLDGWRLSPVYDLELSVPGETEPRLHTAIVDDCTAFSVQDALEVAEFFGLTMAGAKARLAELGRAVAHWQDEARQAGAAASEIRRLKDAFGCPGV